MSAKRLPRLDLNPSSADRWTTCTASPRFILDNADKIPSSTTRFNQEGTTAHEVAASLLQGRPVNEKDSYACPVPVTPEMWTHGWNYMEYVEALREPGSKLLVEKKLPLWYMPERNCIVDAAVVNRDSLHVIDYKYGEGVVVSPVQSLQATIYAQTIGTQIVPFPADDFPVFIHIYQPRGRAAENGADHVWETTWGEVAEISKEISDKAKLIQLSNVPPFDQHKGLDRAAKALLDGFLDGPADTVVVRADELKYLDSLQFAPSEKACRWCPAKGFCQARKDFLTSGIETLAVIDEKPKQLPSPQTISREQIAAVLTHKDDIEKWLKDVEGYALDTMKAGTPLPGFKLVMSRGGNRAWTDPKKAAKLLVDTTILKREEVVETKIISPAGVEELLGKHGLNAELTALITKPPGSPCIAPADDKREAITVDGASEFETLE